MTLECSHFEPAKRICQELPCVIYLHGNCSSRLECLPCLDVLLPSNITLFSFDFSGCGLSEGEYISLVSFQNMKIKKSLVNNSIEIPIENYLSFSKGKKFTF